MSEGFRRTKQARVQECKDEATYPEDALCHRVEQGLADVMWGFADNDFSARPSKEELELRKAARILCEQCPVRAECLADALVSGVRVGIYGGLGVAYRWRVAAFLEKAGVHVSDKSVSPQIRYARAARVIKTHPEIFDLVKKAEADARRARRAARKQQTEETVQPETSKAEGVVQVALFDEVLA